MIGHRIKKARLDKQLTQSALANVIGVKSQSVHQWEAGTANPRGDRLSKLAMALTVTPQWLQFGDESTPIKNVKTFGEVELFLSSNEFKSYVNEAMTKTIIDSSRMGWLQLSRPDMTVDVISDYFYLRLNEIVGITLNANNSTDKEVINKRI